MKKLHLSLVALLFLMLAGCSGSDTYRGAWKALSPDGGQYDIVFDAKSFSIKDQSGKTQDFAYTQNSVSIKNGVETYGINLKDGRQYKIHFPIAKDESMGLIRDGRGNLLYTIGRKDYVPQTSIVDPQAEE